MYIKFSMKGQQWAGFILLTYKQGNTKTYSYAS